MLVLFLAFFGSGNLKFVVFGRRLVNMDGIEEHFRWLSRTAVLAVSLTTSPLLLLLSCYVEEYTCVRAALFAPLQNTELLRGRIPLLTEKVHVLDPLEKRPFSCPEPHRHTNPQKATPTSARASTSSRTCHRTECIDGACCCLSHRGGSLFHGCTHLSWLY